MIMLRDHISDTIEQLFVALLISRPSKNSESLAILLSCNILYVIYIKTDSAQSSSTKCKNYLLKIYSQHINFLNTIWNFSL